MLHVLITLLLNLGSPTINHTATTEELRNQLQLECQLEKNKGLEEIIGF